MQSSFVATKVMTTTEARSALPGLAQRAREAGADSEIVFFGPNRRPDVALVPAELLERLGPYLEDIVVAERVLARREENAGAPLLTSDEVDEALGFNSERVASDAEELAAELGIS